MTDNYKHYLLDASWVVLLLALGLGPGTSMAAQASYYDCEFDPGGKAGTAQQSDPRVLRFMLNTELKIAFRIDTPTSRPVRMFLAEGGGFSLLDNADPASILLVTVRRDGRSIYSRHSLAAGSAEAAGSGLGLGSQAQGWCHPSMRNAAIPQRSDGRLV